MMKRARIAVDCCGEIRRIICPLKAGFPSQNEEFFKQYTAEVLILARGGGGGYLSFQDILARGGG